jgi:hypothetical protein
MIVSVMMIKKKRRKVKFVTPLLSTSSTVKTALIIIIFILNVLSTFTTIAYNMPQCTEYLTAHFIEVGDFNSSRGYCYELFFSSSLTCPVLYTLPRSPSGVQEQSEDCLSSLSFVLAVQRQSKDSPSTATQSVLQTLLEFCWDSARTLLGQILGIV